MRSFRNNGLILLQIEKVIHEKETSGELILESFKFNAIVHMISKMPLRQLEAYTINRIANGFIQNGQISKRDSPGVPDITRCLGTVWYEYPDQSHQHLQNIFDHFFPTMFDKGNIDKSDYYAFGIIRIDRYSKGNIVSKHALTIQSKKRQHAKVMWSKKQRALWLEERAKRKHEIKRIQRKQYDNEAQIFKRNDECEKLLRKHVIIGNPQNYLPLLGGAAESNFDVSAQSGVTPTVKMLISFIQVRCERQMMKNRSVKYRAGLSSSKK